jgi:hypothetical protein
MADAFAGRPVSSTPRRLDFGGETMDALDELPASTSSQTPHRRQRSSSLEQADSRQWYAGQETGGDRHRHRRRRLASDHDSENVRMIRFLVSVPAADPLTSFQNWTARESNAFPAGGMVSGPTPRGMSLQQSPFPQPGPGGRVQAPFDQAMENPRYIHPSSSRRSTKFLIILYGPN